MSRPGRRRSQTVAGWLFVGLALLVTHRAMGPRELGGPASYVVVRGDSMEPTYSDGDLVVARGKARYEVGDVVTYQPEVEYDFPVIHRVVAVDGDELVTRGDNRDEDDAWGVAAEDVVGSTLFRVPRGGVVLAYLFQPATLFALVVFVAVLLAQRRREARVASTPARAAIESDARLWIDAVAVDDPQPADGRRSASRCEAGDRPTDRVDDGPSRPHRRPRASGSALPVLALAGTVALGATAADGSREAHAATLEVRVPVLQVIEVALDDLPPLAVPDGIVAPLPPDGARSSGAAVSATPGPEPLPPAPSPEPDDGVAGADAAVPELPPAPDEEVAAEPPPETLP